MSVSVCLSVCVTVRVSQKKPHIQTSPFCACFFRRLVTSRSVTYAYTSDFVDDLMSVCYNRSGKGYTTRPSMKSLIREGNTRPGTESDV